MFTSARFRKPGLVETAKGGTLFLDEIGDASPPMQVKRLRLIESHTFRRVDGVETQTADFRLIAATGEPPHARVGDGLFRGCFGKSCRDVARMLAGWHPTRFRRLAASAENSSA